MDDTNFCRNILPPTEFPNNQIFVANADNCTRDVSDAISSLPNLLSADPFSATCRNAVLDYACRIYHRSCSNPAPPCSSDCIATTAACSTTELGLLSAAGFDLNAICANPATAAPGGSCFPRTVQIRTAPANTCFANYTSRVCAGVNYDVYVKGGMTIVDLERMASQAYKAFVGRVSSACYTAMSKYVCGRIFMRCDKTALTSQGLPLPIPLPQFPCDSICQNYATQCPDVIAFAQATGQAELVPSCSARTVIPPAVNCSGSVKSPGLPDFPSGNQIFGVVASKVMATPCQSLSTASVSYNLTALIGSAVIPADNVCRTVLNAAEYPDWKIAVENQNQCPLDVAAQISAIPSLLSASNFGSACRASIMELTCRMAFRPYRYPTPPCASDCVAAFSACSVNEQIMLSAAGLSTTATCTDTSKVGMLPFCNPRNTTTAPLVTPSVAKCQTGYRSQFCMGLDYDIYVPAGKTIAFLEETAASTFKAFAANVNPTCYQAMAKYFCGRIFMECDPNSLPRQFMPLYIPLPRFPCQSVCQDYATRCPDVIAFAQATGQTALIPDCTTSALTPASYNCTSMTSPALPDFPVGTQVFGKLGAATLSTECQNLSGKTVSFNMSNVVPGDIVPSGHICRALLKPEVYPGWKIALASNTSCATEQAGPISSLVSLAAAENFSPECRSSILEFMCRVAYRPQNNPVGPCATDCGVAFSKCTNTEQFILNAAGLNMASTCSNQNYVGMPPFCNSRNINVVAPPPAPMPKCIRNFNSRFCRNLNYDVYVPGDRTIDDLEALAGQLAQAFSAMVPDDCYYAMSKYFCSRIFRECVYDAVPRATGGQLKVTLPMPKFPCKRVCTEYGTRCAALIAAAGVADLVPDCNSAGITLPPSRSCSGALTSVPIPEFPEGDLVLGAFGPGNLTTPCQDYATRNVFYAAPTDLTSWVAESLPNEAPPVGFKSIDIKQTNSFCKNVLPYNMARIPVSTCQNDLELKYLSTLTTMLASPAVSAPCRDAVAYIMCAKTFPDASSSMLRPCRGDCERVHYHCSQTELGVFNTLGFNFHGSICPMLPSSTSGQCFARSVLTPTLVPKLPRCQLYQSQVCKGVNYPVYVPADMTVDELEAKAKSAQFLFTFQSAPGCPAAMARYVCSQVFRRCDMDAVNRALNPPVPLPLPLPRFPCRSVCDDYATKCALTLGFLEISAGCDAIGGTQPAAKLCDGTVVAPGLPDFPATASVFAQLAGQFVATPCEAYADNVTYVTDSGAAVSYPNPGANMKVDWFCPAPLVVPDDPANVISGTKCATPCPSFLILPEQWTAGRGLLLGLTIPSFICLTFMVATWMFPIKLKSRDQRLILFFSFWLWLIAFALLVGFMKQGYGSIEKIICKDNSLSNGQGDSAVCTFQGVIFFMACHSAATWWMIIAFDIFFKINFTVLAKQTDWIRDIVYQAFCWIMMLSFLITALAENYIGGTVTTPWCFTYAYGPDKWDWRLFYLPIIVYLILGTFFMTSVIVTLISSFLKTSGTKGSAAEACLKYLRPLLFVLQFLFIFALLIQSKLDYFFNQRKWENSGVDFVSCLLAGGSNTEESCGRLPKEHLNIASWYLLILCVGGQGIINFFCYGTQPENYRLWYSLLTTGSTTGVKADAASKNSSVSKGSASGSAKTSATTKASASSSAEAKSTAGSKKKASTSTEMSKK